MTSEDPGVMIPIHLFLNIIPIIQALKFMSYLDTVVLCVLLIVLALMVLVILIITGCDSCDTASTRIGTIDSDNILDLTTQVSHLVTRLILLN